MTEAKLPEELEEQAMLHALGVLDSDDRRAFMVRLQGESQLLRQAAMAYQAVTDALASAVVPVAPPASLRERLASRVALEAARELESFELTANTVALSTFPVKPRDALRKQLLSRIMKDVDVQLHVKDSVSVADESTVSQRGERACQSEIQSPQNAGSLVRWLYSCRTALSNFLRTIVIRSMTSDRVRYWKAKMTFQQPTKGLTYIRASEGAWRMIASGVSAKLLSFDSVSRRTTTLLRFAPRTRYAPHRHTAVEELYVLEGGCTIGGQEMAVGDYHRAEAGTVHHDTSTDDGCLLLVISSPQNEMLQ